MYVNSTSTCLLSEDLKSRTQQLMNLFWSFYSWSCHLHHKVSMGHGKISHQTVTQKYLGNHLKGRFGQKNKLRFKCVNICHTLHCCSSTAEPCLYADSFIFKYSKLLRLTMTWRQEHQLTTTWRETCRT